MRYTLAGYYGAERYVAFYAKTAAGLHPLKQRPPTRSEIYESISPLVASAAMANGDLALVVPAAFLAKRAH